MATSTKIRPLSRLIDKASTPFWVIGPDGRLVFLSAAVGDWLTVETESLVGRSCIAGASISEDPLDYLAASLAAPPGFSQSGSASLLIQPTIPGSRPRRVPPMETRFVRLGAEDDALTLAIAGVFTEQATDPVIETAVLLRQQLDSWRRHHHSFAIGVTVGNSRSAARVHQQIRLAESVRANLMIQSPPGCFANSIANSVHQRSAPNEPIVSIDGPLMDAELLDASLGMIMHRLEGDDHSKATAILSGIDETPSEAQQRLAEHIGRFDNRLRLIAISSYFPKPMSKDAEVADSELLLDENQPLGIDNLLADHLCGLRIRLGHLAHRVEDIPLIATSMLDRRRAAGDATADRMSRATLDAMVMYPWPDNFRELDQAIRHASRACHGEVIGVEHLPLAIRSYRPNESVPVDQQAIDLDEVVAKFEADLIRKAVDAADGNRAEAARRLNVSRARLLRKLETIEGDDRA